MKNIVFLILLFSCTTTTVMPPSTTDSTAYYKQVASAQVLKIRVLKDQLSSDSIKTVVRVDSMIKNWNQQISRIKLTSQRDPDQDNQIKSLQQQVNQVSDVAVKLAIDQAKVNASLEARFVNIGVTFGKTIDSLSMGLDTMQFGWKGKTAYLKEWNRMQRRVTALETKQ